MKTNPKKLSGIVDPNREWNFDTPRISENDDPGELAACFWWEYLRTGLDERLRDALSKLPGLLIIAFALIDHAMAKVPTFYLSRDMPMTPSEAAEVPKRGFRII